MSWKKPVAVVLAGGEGKRFAPLTVDKTMFPFLGKPLIGYTLEMLERVGFEEALVVVNRANRQYVESFSSDRLKIRTVPQGKPLGQADALLSLGRELGSDPVVVMNAADVVDDSLLKRVLARSRGEWALVSCIRMKEYFPGGYLRTLGDRVVEVVEKPKQGREPSDLVSLVFYYFSKPGELIEVLKKQAKTGDDGFERGMSRLFETKKVSWVEYDGAFAKLKYPHFVLEVMKVLLERLSTKIDPEAKVARSAVLEGKVVIERGAKIDEHSVIKGPSYIGKNAIVGTGCLVSQSTIEEGVVVGSMSEVSRSYVGPGCLLHGNFVGDSVLEAEVNPSFGTVFTNFRLDRSPVTLKTAGGKIDTGKTKLGCVAARGVFMGANCSIMPGVTIGARAKIYPGKVVYQAVGADEVVK